MDKRRPSLHQAIEAPVFLSKGSRMIHIQTLLLLLAFVLSLVVTREYWCEDEIVAGRLGQARMGGDKVGILALGRWTLGLYGTQLAFVGVGIRRVVKYTHEHPSRAQTTGCSK
jgi:hypothetical protein